MSTKTQIKAPVVARHMEILPGHVHLFEMASPRPGVNHVQELDLEQMTGMCSCEHFRFKLAAKNRGLGDSSNLCKHLHASIEFLLDHSFLDAEDLQAAEVIVEFAPCCECNQPGAELLRADEQGNPLDGMLCSECFLSARALNFDYSDYAWNLHAEITMLEEKRDAMKADDIAFGTNSHARELDEIHERLMSLWSQFMAEEPIEVRS